MHVTREQYDQMLQQRDELQQKLEEALLEIGEAGGTNDWHDNPALEHAQHEAAILRGKVDRILREIDEAVIVEASQDLSIVRIGHAVTVQLDDEEFPEEYTILGALHANPLHGIISSESPLGKALLGKPKGALFSYNTPIGVLNGQILDIKIPELS